MQTTTKERYQKIKQALDNGMGSLAATKKFNASMTTISRIKTSKNYEEFLTIGKPAQRQLKIKPATKKVATKAIPKTQKTQPQVARKSPWDKLKSFFGI